MIPGEICYGEGQRVINGDNDPVVLSVSNRGDRPVQVGSHFHFFEVNAALAFDRPTAFGMRLDIPAGTAVRFEPGTSQEVSLIPIGGARRIFGLNGLTEGSLDDPLVRKAALEAARKQGFMGESR
ncbi:MAG: urease subunit beta [Sulfobacillus thermosulfidooxidans]|nr:MAG: urease subunit beta [Sulfobacillus thermosulfidooxidans]